MTCTNCNTSSCPEPVPVIINTANVTSSGLTVPVLSFVRDFETQGTLTIRVEDPLGALIAHRFSVVIWFENGADFSGNSTFVPPTNPGSQTIEKFTDDAGVATVALGNTTSATTWYAYARIGGVLCTEPATVVLGS